MNKRQKGAEPIGRMDGVDVIETWIAGGFTEGHDDPVDDCADCVADLACEWFELPPYTLNGDAEFLAMSLLASNEEVDLW